MAYLIYMIGYIIWGLFMFIPAIVFLYLGIKYNTPIKTIAPIVIVLLAISIVMGIAAKGAWKRYKEWKRDNRR